MAFSYENDNESDDRNDGANPFNSSKNLGDLEKSATDGIGNDEKPSDTAQTAQEEVENEENKQGDKSFYEPDSKEGNKRSDGKDKFPFLLKKRNGIIGGLIALIFGTGFAGVFFGQSSMLINLYENMTLTNDSTSSAIQRRVMKTFAYSSKNDLNALCASKKIKCKMGKISNSALRRLSKKGITPIGDDGKPMKLKRIGYPKKNPSVYAVDMGDGTTKNIKAKDMPGFLSQKENRKLARKILGTSGAFNMRLLTWRGKYLTKKLYKVFNIAPNGGLASEANSKVKDAKQRMKKVFDKIPKSEKIKNSASNIKEKLKKHTGKAKKGGVAYLVAVGICFATKIPSYTAGAVAAVQLAQVMSFAMDTVLSPGSAMKASGVSNSFTPESAEAIGTLLTERTPRESDGQLSSALDSKYLLSAIGVNKSKPPVSKDFAPGYSTLTHPAIATVNKADKAMEPVCNVVMAPATMLASAAVSAVAGGGILNFAGSYIISGLISEAVGLILSSETAMKALVEIASNDKISKVKGEELGDVIGISAASFFSAGGMTRHLPTLKKSEVVAFNKMRAENEEFQREMDIAALSPFDTSSRYTFLGSITHGLTESMLRSGSYNTSFASVISNISRLPSMALSFTPKASASSVYSENYCDYASEFNLDTGDGNTPAINMAGLPCVGITPTQDSMSTEEAISLIENENWFDDSKDIADDATIDDLVETGYIKKDTPLYDFIEDCSSPATGDYLFNAASCTVDDNPVSSDLSDIEIEGGVKMNEDDKKNITNGPENDLKNPRSMAAISVFLLDYQIIQSINGEDEPDYQGASAPQPFDGAFEFPVEQDADNSLSVTSCFGPRNINVEGASTWHPAIDIGTNGKAGIPAYAAGSGTVEIIYRENEGYGRYGNFVAIKHDDDLYTHYAHLASIDVQEGQQISRGDKVGIIGGTGGFAIHLDFGFSKNGKPSPSTAMNPLNYIRIPSNIPNNAGCKSD